MLITLREIFSRYSPQTSIEDRIAKHVSDLKNTKDNNQKNQEILADHISVLSEIHGLSKSEIEHIFNDEIKLKQQENFVINHTANKAVSLSKQALTLLVFLIVLLIVMYLIISLK